MADSINPRLVETLSAYNMPAQGLKLLHDHPPLIIAGITAAGKDTITERIVQLSDYRQVADHTTRPPRPGEINGQHYWFINETAMLNLLSNHQLFEASLVHGVTVYGSSLEAYQAVLDSGRKPLFIMDVQGIEKLMNKVPNLKPVFLLPPSFDEWLRRLNTRLHMTDAERRHRFNSAIAELEHVREHPSYQLIVNKNVASTVKVILGEVKSDQKEAQETLDKLLQSIQEVIH